MDHRHSPAMITTVIAAGTTVVAACSPSSSGSGSSPGNTPPGSALAEVTPAGTKPVSSVVWATNRDVISLDPITSAGYPEYTADSLMCESLLRQAPDGSLQPGLATVSNPSPVMLVFTLRPGVRFWDGHPVTSADVVYSLDRAASPGLGGYYAGRLDRITSVTATSPARVTVKLTRPDYWLEGELSSMPGIIIEKSFAEKQGKNYGTPAGSIMCTGAYMLHSWTPGVGVVAVANPRYWNPSVRPLAGQITLRGVHDVTSLTSGLLTGDIQGTYFVPGGAGNWDNFSSPPITAALEQARGTANPDQRAALVAKAEKLAIQQLPWIPDVQPDTVLVLGKGLTGAVSSSAYLFAPWADQLGGTG